MQKTSNLPGLALTVWSLDMMWKRIQLAEICKKSYFDNFACGLSALYSSSLKIEDQQLVCLLRNIYIYIIKLIRETVVCVFF